MDRNFISDPNSPCVTYQLHQLVSRERVKNFMDLQAKKKQILPDSKVHVF